MTDDTRRFLSELLTGVLASVQDLTGAVGELRGDVRGIRREISTLTQKVESQTSIRLAPAKSSIPWTAVIKIAAAGAIIISGAITALIAL